MDKKALNETECLKSNKSEDIESNNLSLSRFLLFDLVKHECNEFKIMDVLNITKIFSRKPCLLYIKVGSRETIELIFQAYKLNPLLEAECSE